MAVNFLSRRHIHAGPFFGSSCPLQGLASHNRDDRCGVESRRGGRCQTYGTGFAIHGSCCLAAKSCSKVTSWVCAVARRRFPVGVSPTRQPLPPEATGAVTEVTKWLKPSVSVSRYTVTARVCRP